MDRTLEIKISQIDTKKEYYDVEIKTDKQEIKGVFHRAKLRHLIEVVDNAINIGW